MRPRPPRAGGARSLNPKRYDAYNTQQTPTTSAGIMGTNTVPTSMASALAARAVGPPHGSMFMTPPANMVTQASTSGRRVIRVMASL